MIAESIASALERAGLPGGVLSVLHDDGEDTLRSAIGGARATFFRASGYPLRVKRVERLAFGGDGSGSDFGAGLRHPPALAVELAIVRVRSQVVRSTEDPAARAAEIARAAFGRSETFSGQLDGQCARAVCAERSFSRFTEALLAELRRSPDVARPVPLVERESEEHLRRVRVLGLDENATLIFDGESRPGGAVPASPAKAGDAILAPTVFTNVEERMRLAWLGRPIPLLCLLRVPTDDQAQSLAARLDRDVPAEDLALDPAE